MTIAQRRIATNGIELNIAEQGDGPLVLLLHGFPESWYSWRHQFEPLAAAGYHAVAPDMRGYGNSDRPDVISAYNQIEVTNDIIGLIPALGYERAVVIGHDWGAPTAWRCALCHPDRVSAVGALSVPFMPRSPVPPLAAMRELFKDQFFYQLYFQEPGVAEAEFERDLRTALKQFLLLLGGEGDLSVLVNKAPHDDLLGGFPNPTELPDWLTAADLDFYTAEFERSGMRGPLNYYRNHDLTWELSANDPQTIEQPALFVAGEQDGVIAMAADALTALPERVPNLREQTLLPGVGHWTQQEAPAEVNAALLRFLDAVV